MSNTYFQFKQFTIAQDKCALKVTTDACIQGAYTPVPAGAKRVLDIGAGTGLLSLMLAQKSEVITIDAIELDSAAAAQAADNVAASPWAQRVKVVEADACDYTATEGYDLIISNPPFFNNSLLSNDAVKDLARHTLSLSYAQLVDAVNRNLKVNGSLSVLLPYAEYTLLRAMLTDAGYYEAGTLTIRHTAGAKVNRVVGLFSKIAISVAAQRELVIKDGSGAYTPAFTALLAPYYLYL